MSTTTSRIAVLGGCLFAGLVIVLGHLYGHMVVDHEVWARRSHQNRWTFRSVPDLRGTLRDRSGAPLAWDEPTMELAVHYERFRVWHAVGAAVHGATAWARLQPGGEGTDYGYLDGRLGPDAAARDLLAMPVAALRPGAYDKAVTTDLGTLATTVLAAATGLPRKQVFQALRQAALFDRAARIGDVMPGFTYDELVANHARLLEQLRGFDADLVAEQRRRDPDHAAASLLFPELEKLREASLLHTRVEWPGEAARKAPADGEAPEQGEARPAEEGEAPPADQRELVEAVAAPFVEHVPFELAARLRVGAADHPGFVVSPSVQRVTALAEGTPMRALLGLVVDVSRLEHPAEWLAAYPRRELSESWSSDLVPAEAAPTAEDRERMEKAAEATLQQALLQNARCGVSGLERGFDGELTGRLGLRLVERDARRREQQLGGSLRAQAGEDVALTFDLDLQRVVERQVAAARHKNLAGRGHDALADRLCGAALAVVDAASGDVLAFAGDPVRGSGPRAMLGASWPGNGSLGSVVKPFVLLEQMHAAAVGAPHTPLEQFAPCNKRYRTGLSCDEVHGREGTDPVKALAKSCNCFFYQCAEGLGEAGVERAMRRFGLLEPTGPDDPFAACWQGAPDGLWIHAPVWTRNDVVARRGIGYEIHASPLTVARAYAALATGRLPTLGVRAGERRPFVPLRDVEGDLDLVREGLRDCVTSGTGRRIAALGEFGVLGKTGTAQVGEKGGQNNAWFAGFLPEAGPGGVHLCFCGVVYWVADGVHGGDAAGALVGDFLTAVRADGVLASRYLGVGGGR